MPYKASKRGAPFLTRLWLCARRLAGRQRP